MEILTDSIINDRFTANAKSAFSNLKRLTSYNTFGKRDGSIVCEAILPDGTKVESPLLDG